MYYKEFSPGSILKKYVQCYFVCENNDIENTEDKVFASGVIEIMFNIGADGTQQIDNGNLTTKPDIQLWGQTIQPLTFKTFEKHAMLGIRFFTHTAACFFNEPISQFNDRIIDFVDIGGAEAVLLYSQLRDVNLLTRRIELIEAFLMQRLFRFNHKFNKLKLVSEVMQDLRKDDFLENISSVASSYGISSRYLQKIFFDYSGLSPNLFTKIARFQKSMQLVADNYVSLTAIAYQCGYFDQSHFIKDFKFFSGSTPSAFSPETSTDFMALNQ